MRRAFMLAALILSATPLLAHHNTEANYDAEKPVPLSGTVTAVLWRNPHTLVFVDVKDATGSIVNWKVEWMPAMVIFRQGFTKDSLHVGDAISMTVCLAKDGSQTAAAQFVLVTSAFENHRIGTSRPGRRSFAPEMTSMYSVVGVQPRAST